MACVRCARSPRLARRGNASCNWLTPGRILRHNRFVKPHGAPQSHSMIHLLKPGEDSYKTVTLAELRASKTALEEALWIDLFQPTEEEELFVEKRLGVDLPSKEEMGEIAESSRLFEEKDALYLSCWLLCFDTAIPLNSSVSFVITSERFVSIRYSDHHAFRVYSSARNRLQSRKFQSCE